MAHPYPSCTLEEGQRLWLKVSVGSIDRITAAGVDFYNPPLKSDWRALVNYTITVVAACAYADVDGKLQPAGLTAANVADLVAPQDIVFLKEAVNQAIEKYNAGLALGARAWNEFQAAKDEAAVEFGAQSVGPLVMWN